ncbi:hypothetical protein BT63DRAFT_479856 [Microthyrium microscopicum]|uniref:Rhodopsin domain-containing protein n=1 Tax=Microthyrium microscopicum TaxID=703497 RepID=A0A6A6U861_9PEZI|nr:hypothetical protein BT63DRAFT_479856 [Microthyrium microscopicum]
MSSPSANVDSTRFAPITKLDHSGYIWIASLLSAVYSTLSLWARIHIKRAYFGLDDWVCAGATVAGLSSFITVWVGTSQGLGKSRELLQESQLEVTAQAVFATHVTFLIAIYLAKCSVILLIRRIFSEDMHRYRTITDGFTAFMAISGLTSILLVSVRCVPSQLFLDGLNFDTCASRPQRWKAIAIIDGITEVTVVVLSLTLVWQLQMKAELKFRVILAFLFRLLLVPIIVLHAYYIQMALLGHEDLPLALTPVLVCTQIELGYSLISATIPNLKSFLMSFDTAFMMDAPGQKIEAFSMPASPTTETARQSQLSATLTNSPTITERTYQKKPQYPIKLRPDMIDRRTSIQHFDDWSLDVEEGSENESIGKDGRIRRDFQWSVEGSDILKRT